MTDNTPNITKPSQGERLEELLKALPCTNNEDLANLEFLCDEELLEDLTNKEQLRRDLRALVEEEGLSIDEAAQKLLGTKKTEEKKPTNREWQANRDKRKLFDLVINDYVYKCCAYRDEVFIYRSDEKQETDEFNYSILLDTEGTEAEALFKAYKWSDFEEYTRLRIFPLYFLSRELAGVNKDFTLRLEAMIYIYSAFFPREVEMGEIVEEIEDIKENSQEVYDDISRLFDYALDGDKPLELSAEELKHILKEACNMDVSVGDIEGYCKELNLKLVNGDNAGDAKPLHPFLEALENA